jgi:enoyl-[acyl-carrier-protein] reductase (NADH)
MTPTRLFEGKRVLIFGIANERSIAWGIAQAMHAHGASFIITYAGDAFEKRVRPLAVSEEFTSNTDVRSLALSHLIQLQRNIKNNIPVVTHRMTKAHLQYLQREIDNVIGESKEPVRFIPPYNPDISIKSDGK